VPRASREYLAWNVGTDPVEVQRRVWQIEDTLRELNKSKRVSWFGKALNTPAELEEEALDAERVHAMTGGTLPVIFLNVTFYVGEVTPQDLANIEQQFGLQLFGEFTEPDGGE
jgi:hypothetical protein